jgi:cytochrome c556
MTTQTTIRRLFPCLTILALSAACTSDNFASDREELMEGVRDAAKPVGAMLKGEKEFDADTLQESLAVFAEAAGKLGSLVPEGSAGGEASPAIWDDPEGFAAAIKKWQDTTAAAIAAAPQSLEAAGPVMKPVMGNCKACHDDYRVEDE